VVPDPTVTRNDSKSNTIENELLAQRRHFVSDDAALVFDAENLENFDVCRGLGEIRDTDGSTKREYRMRSTRLDSTDRAGGWKERKKSSGVRTLGTKRCLNFCFEP
jgi:hypothetical protein